MFKFLKGKIIVLKKSFVIFTALFIFLIQSVLASPAWQIPESGVKLEGEAKQEYMKNFMREFYGQKKYKKEFVPPDNWSYDKLEIEGVSVERLENTAMPNDRIVLQCHGGGFESRLSNFYRYYGVRQGVLTSARAVYMLNYSVLPKYKFPFQLNEAVKVYKYLLNHGAKPENIYVFGDSSGGNLALALAQKLKSEKIPQPGAYILLSPWATAEKTMPSRIINKERDIILGTNNPYLYNKFNNSTYPNETFLTNPLISPMYGDYSGVSPMLIQVGSYELFFDEDLALFNKVARDGVNATITVYPEMPHVFSMLMPELQESIDSFREIKNFIDTLNR